MKCNNCHCGEYQTVEIVKFDGIKHERQYCSCCDDEHFEPIYTRRSKRRFNKAKFLEFASLTSMMLFVFIFTLLTLFNFERLSTIY